MPVCLNLGLLPCSCLFSLCGFVAYWSLVPVACLVASVPFGGLFGCNHVWKHIFVIFGLLATCFSPLCLALQVRLFHVSLYKCLITAYPSLLCDKMLSFLYACYACFVPFFWLLHLLALLHPCLCLHTCVFVCLFVSSSLVPTYNLMRVHTCLLYKRSRVPFRNFA